MSNENQTGQVVAFDRSPDMLRRRAAVCVKARQYDQAITLLHQAMELDPSGKNRLAAGQVLLAMGCYEQGAHLMLRALAHPDAPADCWLVLRDCHLELNQEESAADAALYHLLYSHRGAEAAQPRSLALLPPTTGHITREHTIRRSRQLLHRALLTWQRGRHVTARKQLLRAARMTDTPEQAMTTLGLLELAADDLPRAYRHLTIAMFHGPDNMRAATGMCFVLYGMGRKQDAQALLDSLAPQCVTGADEPLFVTAALGIHQPQKAADYLTDHLRSKPFRTQLLHQQAYLSALGGDPEAALRLWQRVLVAAPGDQLARLQWQRVKAGEQPLPLHDPAAVLPHLEPLLINALTEVLYGQPVPDMELRLLSAEAPRLRASADELLRSGSLTRQLLDWAFEAELPQLHLPLLRLLLDLPQPSEQLPAYLCELLMLPTLALSLKRSLVDTARRMGAEPKLLRTEQGVVRLAQDMPPEDTWWPAFLRLVLLHTRRYGQSMIIAFNAAICWQRLDHAHRAEAVLRRRYDYVKAVELHYLRLTSQTMAEAAALKRLHTSRRRVSRILRLFEPGAAPLKGVDHHEMHRL